MLAVFAVTPVRDRLTCGLRWVADVRASSAEAYERHCGWIITLRARVRRLYQSTYCQLFIALLIVANFCIVAADAQYQVCFVGVCEGVGQRAAAEKQQTLCSEQSYPTSGFLSSEFSLLLHL